MQNVATVKNWSSWYQPVSLFIILMFNFTLKFQFSDKYLVKWLRLLDKLQLFGPQPRPNWL